MPCVGLASMVPILVHPPRFHVWKIPVACITHANSMKTMANILDKREEKRLSPYLELCP